MMIHAIKMMLKKRLRQKREMKTYKTDLSHWSQDLLESSNGFTENQKKNIQNYNFENLRKQIFPFIIKNFCRIELATYTTKTKCKSFLNKKNVDFWI